jgi:hypothetical protein
MSESLGVAQGTDSSPVPGSLRRGRIVRRYFPSSPRSWAARSSPASCWRWDFGSGRRVRISSSRTAKWPSLPPFGSETISKTWLKRSVWLRSRGMLRRAGLRTTTSPIFAIRARPSRRSDRIDMAHDRFWPRPVICRSATKRQLSEENPTFSCRLGGRADKDRASLITSPARNRPCWSHCKCGKSQPFAIAFQLAARCSVVRQASACAVSVGL